jgi:hypothetical protein
MVEKGRKSGRGKEEDRFTKGGCDMIRRLAGKGQKSSQPPPKELWPICLFEVHFLLSFPLLFFSIWPLFWPILPTPEMTHWDERNKFPFWMAKKPAPQAGSCASHKYSQIWNEMKGKERKMAKLGNVGWLNWLFLANFWPMG